MKQIVVFTTSNTITVKPTPMVAGAVPLLKGDDFLAALPRAGLQLSFEEFASLPGSHMTPAGVFELSRRIAASLDQPNVAGVVVTHGSDTLEESAYLLDLTLASPKPVVLTGAIRPVNSPDFDGVVNLATAIRVAAAPEAHDLGVLVAIDDEIHAAASVQNQHAQARGAFGSPDGGPLGRVDGGKVRIRRRPGARQQILGQRIEEQVDLIRVSQGADVRPLRHSVEDGVAGVVIEAFGGGRVPPWWLPQISEAVRRRVAVVIATRCQAGSLGDEYGYVGAYHDLRRLGVLFAHQLDGLKARVKLMLALGAARGPHELRQWFADE